MDMYIYIHIYILYNLCIYITYISILYIYIYIYLLINQTYFSASYWLNSYVLARSNQKICQGHSERTSSVAFEVLMIRSETDFIILFIFNCLTLNINLFNFNCLTSNFCFQKKIFFTSRGERMFMDARPQFQFFYPTGKMMTCYL